MSPSRYRAARTSSATEKEYAALDACLPFTLALAHFIGVASEHLANLGLVQSSEAKDPSAGTKGRSAKAVDGAAPLPTPVVVGTPAASKDLSAANKLLPGVQGVLKTSASQAPLFSTNPPVQAAFVALYDAYQWCKAPAKAWDTAEDQLNAHLSQVWSSDTKPVAIMRAAGDAAVQFARMATHHRMHTEIWDLYDDPACGGDLFLDQTLYAYLQAAAPIGVGQALSPEASTAALQALAELQRQLSCISPYQQQEFDLGLRVGIEIVQDRLKARGAANLVIPFQRLLLAPALLIVDAGKIVGETPLMQWVRARMDDDALFTGLNLPVFLYDREQGALMKVSVCAYTPPTLFMAAMKGAGQQLQVLFSGKKTVESAPSTTMPHTPWGIALPEAKEAVCEAPWPAPWGATVTADGCYPSMALRTALKPESLGMGVCGLLDMVEGRGTCPVGLCGGLQAELQQLFGKGKPESVAEFGVGLPTGEGKAKPGACFIPVPTGFLQCVDTAMQAGKEGIGGKGLVATATEVSAEPTIHVQKSQGCEKPSPIADPGQPVTPGPGPRPPAGETPKGPKGPEGGGSGGGSAGGGGGGAGGEGGDQGGSSCDRACQEQWAQWRAQEGTHKGGTGDGRGGGTGSSQEGSHGGGGEGTPPPPWGNNLLGSPPPEEGNKDPLLPGPKQPPDKKPVPATLKALIKQAEGIRDTLKAKDKAGILMYDDPDLVELLALMQMIDEHTEMKRQLVKAKFAANDVLSDSFLQDIVTQAMMQLTGKFFSDEDVANAFQKARALILGARVHSIGLRNFTTNPPMPDFLGFYGLNGNMTIYISPAAAVVYGYGLDLYRELMLMLIHEGIAHAIPDLFGAKEEASLRHQLLVYTIAILETYEKGNVQKLPEPDPTKFSGKSPRLIYPGRVRGAHKQLRKELATGGGKVGGPKMCDPLAGNCGGDCNLQTQQALAMSACLAFAGGVGSEYQGPVQVVGGGVSDPSPMDDTADAAMATCLESGITPGNDVAPQCMGVDCEQGWKPVPTGVGCTCQKEQTGEGKDAIQFPQAEACKAIQCPDGTFPMLTASGCGCGTPIPDPGKGPGPGPNPEQ